MTSRSPSPPLGDRALLAAIAAKDRDAFRTFYDRYARRVFATVLRQVNDASLAQDLVQDVFLALWAGARGYQETLGEPDQWLFAIVRNKVRDHWRRVGRADEVALEPETVAEAGSWREVRRADARMLARRAVTGLSPDQWSAVEKVYVEGLTFTTAAESLGIPAGTLKSRIHAALGIMRASLRDRS